MVAKCCIKGCKSEKYPGCEMTFHGFPSNDTLKTKWMEATRIEGNVKYKRICPLHFQTEDFMIKGSVIRLKQNVIPSFCRPPFRTCSKDDKSICKSTLIDCLTENASNEKYVENVYKHVDTSDNDKLQDSNVTEKTREDDSIARCKCCLESDRLKSMWQEHCRDGVTEVYGTMLIECFALHWRRPQNTKNSPDLICESCVARLRDAVNFKTEVLASEQLLNGQLEADVDKLKQERDDVDGNIQTEYLHCEYLNGNTNDIEVDGTYDDDGIDVHEVNNDDEKNTEGGKEIAIKTEPHPTLNDTLTAPNKEETCTKKQTGVTLRKRKQSARPLDAVPSRASVPAKRLKVSKKALSNGLKISDGDLTKSYLADIENFSERIGKSEEGIPSNKMSGAMTEVACTAPRNVNSKEADALPKISEWKEDKETDQDRVIKNGVVFIEIEGIVGSEKEASERTIVAVKEELSNKKTENKIKQTGIGKKIKKSGENRLAEMKKQTNNIAIILEFTNATPVRRHGGIGYGCCFCIKEFPDAADLKQHTVKEHDMKTKRNYAKGKRPSAYLVKLDITGLKCNLCGNTIDSLEQLYDHLIEVHKKLLYRNAKKYIVPFKFDQEELRCLFCEFICNSFKGLLEHMSVHYRNHICEICDAGFLTKNNLFNHAGRHKKGTFKCDYCPKVFDTSSKKAGHQRLVHSSTNGVNRCGYCGEMFGTYRRKEKHLITAHGITLKKLKCKACDKTFETQTGLRIHTKRDHLIERRFKCSVCDKRCFTNVQLNQHTLKHTGVKKFQCTVCLKAYGRKSTLREHMRIHENDRRFKCELCGMAFVQKCSWRGHMLSKHGQQV